MKAITPATTLAMLVSLVLSGCQVEPHACSLDANSSDPGIAACAATEDASCVVNSHPACNGEVCIQWRGEPGFCSTQCKTHADCGEFEDCVEVVLASGEKHCISSGLLD